jgi:hypothetical protein
MEEKLIQAGWSKFTIVEYHHWDGRKLQRWDARTRNPGWYLIPLTGKPQRIGKTLKDAIEKLIGVSPNERVRRTG